MQGATGGNMANYTKKLVVLVHGWSVHNTKTYGKLPDRLQSEAQRNGGLRLDVRQIWLGKYVSFRDEIRLEDVSRAFDAAVKRELGALLDQGRRFICITHSTGGPVVRDWWDRYYVQKGRAGGCPMSHLVMLAPANFGSALAQLGKSRIGRLKSWFEGVEPGEGILDWLEHGSPEAWTLNERMFDYPDTTTGRNTVFPFVLTGQQIDRSMYDHVNAYTGELGSDGVVRVAAANLNAIHIRLEQQAPRQVGSGRRPKYQAPMLKLREARQTHRTAFAIVKGRAHSGKDMGILRSIRNNPRPDPTVDAILDCIRVDTPRDYRTICEQFEQHTAAVVQDELLEVNPRLLLPDQYFIHDPHSMIIFRIQDDWGYVVDEFDLELTAGPENDPNHLPSGFFRDRQRNKRHRGTLTYFVNHAVMSGAGEVRDNGNLYREVLPGAKSLGFRVHPYLDTDLVHYLDAELKATRARLEEFLKPHQTTMVDVTIRRVVRERVFHLTKDRSGADFRKEPAGPIGYLGSE